MLVDSHPDIPGTIITEADITEARAKRTEPSAGWFPKDRHELKRFLGLVLAILLVMNYVAMDRLAVRRDAPGSACALMAWVKIEVAEGLIAAQQAREAAAKKALAPPAGGFGPPAAGAAGATQGGQP